MWPAIIAAGAQLAGGAYDNAMKESLQNQSQAWSADQYAHRYQTTVQDLQAAGLNPMLAYSQGAGTPPTSVAPQYNDPIGPAVKTGIATFSANREADKTAAEVKVLDKEADLKEAEAATERARPWLVMAQEGQAHASAQAARTSSGLAESQQQKIYHEIQNIPKEGDRLDALVKNLSATYELIRKQTQNEEEAIKRTSAMAIKLLYEADLTRLDVEAAKKFDNLGREYKQIAPVIQLLQSIISRR